MSKNSRHLKNLFIAPKAQWSMVWRFVAVVLVSMGVFITVALVPLWYFVESLKTMFGPEDPAKTAFIDLIQHYFVGVTLLGIAILAAVAIWGLFYSHRIYGAQYAINRYINEKLIEGQFDATLGLRNYDFLTETAESLNKLALRMRDKKA